jgi:alkyl sulfatase BDS1-like metallo-beta-lactamase superfamily hydrolase
VKRGAKYCSCSHRIIQSVAWRPELPAEQVDKRILMSRGTSNSYLVTTDDGDVVINTGTPYQGARHRERYEQLLGRMLDVRRIIFTQSHPDHTGGWSAFAGHGVETVAQSFYPDGRLDRTLLKEFFTPRGRRIVGGLAPNPEHVRTMFAPDAEADVTTLFPEHYAFEQGGEWFELYSTPGGETMDSLIVWLPQSRTVFIGNLMGALYGALPHLYTPRGDRQRSARLLIRDIECVLALEPALLITGHDEPIRGVARIRDDLGRILESVRWIHDRTIEGMNAGKDLFTLMDEIKLPPELAPRPGRGPLWWYVRAVWEEHAGWFRHESTTELYPVPPRAVWGELAALAGGPDVLAEHAAAHVAAGRPLQALHLVDIALSVDPGHRATREAQIRALRELVERTGGETYDELAWLEGELVLATAALDG